MRLIIYFCNLLINIKLINSSYPFLMKRFILLLCIASCFTASAQKANKGIVFFKGTWNELLAEAKKQQKLIFVDVYTDWCAPCKVMDAEIFPMQSVGDAYNPLFINYRLDAEKGEGIKLAVKYAVKSYPCYLFLDETGNVLDRDGDYQEAPRFIALAKRAAAAKNIPGSLNELQTKFEKGDRKLDFLKTYLQKRTSLSLDNADALNAYAEVVTEAQLNQPEEIVFLSRHMGSTISKALPLLISRIKLLNAQQQTEVANRLYNKLLYYSFAIAIKEKKLDEAAKRLADINSIETYLPKGNFASLNNLKLLYFKEAKDVPNLKEIGYRMAKAQMAIPADTIAKKDKQQFQEIMEPFFTGKRDSLKVEGFQEGKKLAATQFSASVATPLYTVASSFLSVLDPQDKDLKDAYLWAQHAHALTPNEHTKKLCEQLKEIVSR